MTTQRKDEHSTEFGLWLRKQPELDSGKEKFIATNIDYLWRNYKTGEWMLIEEKRHNSRVKNWQDELFYLLNWCAKRHPKYRGFHVIRFSCTSPDDGEIELDGKKIGRDGLIKFLRFGKEYVPK